MKILYIHQYFTFPDVTGGSRSYDLATSFLKYNHKVVVLSSTSDINFKGNKRWYIVNRDGIEVHYIYLPSTHNMSYLQRIIIFLKFLWFTSLYALKIKTDVVLATSTPLTIGIPALIKKRFTKTPYIFEVRDVWPEAVIAIGAIKNRFAQKLLYQLERIIYKNASAIVPLSIDMQKSIIDRYPKFAYKTKIVIPNISEINRFQNPVKPINLKDKLHVKHKFSILYAGTFGKVNGLDYVINLAEKTFKIDSNIVYILIGYGTEKENIIQMAKDKNVLNKNVFILDPITKNELPDWYTSASMGSSFVIDIKELWANSANKFFDTLAAAKPVLINHEGWQANIIRERNVGYVLPIELSDQTVRGFITYTKDTRLLSEQRVNALVLAKEKFALDVAVESYMSIFSKIKPVK